MQFTATCSWSDDEDEEVPQLAGYDHSEDLWSLASREAANEAVPSAPAVPASTPSATGAEPIEMFDARLSLELLGPGKALDYWEENQDRYPKLRDVMRRINIRGATLLENWIEEELAREREEALERIRTAPRHSGLRLDAEIVRQIVRYKPGALTRQQRKVYELCFERGFSVNQCAQALRIGKETVRTHLRRIRKHRPADWNPWKR